MTAITRIEAARTLPASSFHFSSAGRRYHRAYFSHPIEFDIFVGRFFEIGEVRLRVTKNRKRERKREIEHGGFQ